MKSSVSGFGASHREFDDEQPFRAMPHLWRPRFHAFSVNPQIHGPRAHPHFNDLLSAEDDLSF
ncbi:MAG: hypothetical protein OXG90_08495 [Gammaproteobacteria bacterium]|nr:hypothetical protein [Gammaproteobacteria bacterium]